MRTSQDLQPKKKWEPILGGNPESYWALPFDQRCTHHPEPGAEVRDVSKIGLVGNEDDGLILQRAGSP